MAAISPETPKATPRVPGTRWWLLVAAAIYLVAISVTEPRPGGDAFIYISNALAVRAGDTNARSLWEFGHLFWRPLVYLSSPALMGLAPDGVAWSPDLKAMYGLVWIGRLTGLAAVLLMTDLLRRVTRRPAGMVGAILTMVWGTAFLGCAQGGGPYIVAFALSALALWWSVAGPGGKATKAVGAGTAAAAAAAVWFTFVLIIPATACLIFFLRREERARERYGWMLLTLASSGAVLIAVFALGAGLAGCTSLSGLTEWVRSSSHELRQTRTVLRAVSGCARMLIDLGSSGVLLKRFLLKDPYNPVTAVEVALHVVWRIALFWVFVVMIALGACRAAPGRAMLKVAAIATVPTLFFALVLYEPSSIERFLQLLPFLLLVFAALWEIEGPLARAARIVAIVFAFLLPLMNSPVFFAGDAAENSLTRKRLQEFRRYAGRDDLLMTTVLTDPLTAFHNVVPYDPVNLPGPVRTAPIVVAAVAKTADWRQRFAYSVDEAWHRGGAVWITKAALADRPPASTYWVEGDDSRVQWRELPEFLRRLEYDRDTPDVDGFRRIRHSASTEAALRVAAAQ